MTDIAVDLPASARAETAPSGSFFLPIMTLCRRELVRFFRQRNRVVGALLQPIIFFVLFGAAFNATYKPLATENAPVQMRNMTYQEYFFPGTIVMILLFTAIFSTISIIEDRKEGFLQSVLVAPVSRLSMVLGKILGGTALAVIQGVLFMLIGFLIKIPMDPIKFAEAVGAMTLIAFALTGLGFIIAWRMDSTQGFHAIMSVFLLPMWLLSGSLFPATEQMQGWLYWMIKLNPLTYGVALLRHVFYGANALESLPPFAMSLTITILFGATTMVLSAWIAGKRTAGDLQ